ncbi:MAG: formylglycine-generating enzyme family protein [Planctomycetota bacterium]
MNQPATATPSWSLFAVALLLALLVTPFASTACAEEPATPAAEGGGEGDDPPTEETEAERKAREAAEAKAKAEKDLLEQEAAQAEKEERERQNPTRNGLPPLDPIPTDPSCTPYAGGMILIPRGKATIGTKPAQLASMLEGRPKEQVDVFLFERPQTVRDIGPYLYMRTEVTNAQYLQFMQTSTRVYDTDKERTNTIAGIAREIWSVDEKEARGPKYRAHRQLYEANKEVIWAAFQAAKKNGLPIFDQLVKRLPNGDIDEHATFLAMVHEPLPHGTKLTYTAVRPPDHWAGNTPPDDELDHPVRGISYNDAELFAAWAGMHVQLEEEFEYAARGPEAHTWPWGEERMTDERRANWGTKIVGSDYEARTVPVGEIEAGASWCGAVDQVGNVAEWTGSWFKRYPGDDQKTENSWLGEYVKVIRGGSAKDLEWLVLRPAFRNWQGGGSHAPPYPSNRFPWVGFRCAAYLDPGRDHIGPIDRRITRRLKVRSSWLDEDRYLGAATRDWAPAGTIAENHVHVLGPSYSVVFIPLKAMFFEDSVKENKELWEKPSKANKGVTLKRKSESEFCFLPVGVLHSDVDLVELDIIKPESEMTEDELKDLEKKRKRKDAFKPLTKGGGVAPAGTYIVGYWYGEAALFDASMDLVAFIPKMLEQLIQVDVQKAKADKVPPSSLMLDADLDEGRIQHWFPLGGKKPDAKLWVTLDIGLRFAPGQLYAKSKAEKNPWELSTPATRAEARAAEGGAEGEAKPDGEPDKPEAGDDDEGDVPDEPDGSTDEPEDEPEDEPTKDEPAGEPK